MAEQLMLVCDTCGKPAVETITFKTSSGNRQRDYCATDLQELIQGSRVPKRGRKPGAVAPKTTPRRKTARRKPAAARKSRKKSSSAR